MKRHNNLIFTLAVPLFLVGCGKTSDDLKAITDESKIKEVASSIITNQDSSSFDELNNFVVKTTEKISTNEVLSTHKKNSSETTTHEFSCDIKNYLVKDKSKTTYNTGETEVEVTYYYDKSVNAYYILTNKNGVKTKTFQTGVSLDTGKTLLKNVCSSYITNIKNRTFLENIDIVISEQKEIKEQYKDKSDEYYKYTFGSNDTKSLQLKIESKTKYNASDLDGYITIIDNDIMRDNKESYYRFKTEINTKDKENIYYMNNVDEQITTYTYGGVSIGTPNVGDYTNI